MKPKSLTLAIFVAIVGLLATACIQPLPENGSTQSGDASSTTEQTLYVGPEQADCVGVAPQTCLLVKESPDDDYQFFYGQIDGFDYVPGYEYELIVAVTERENVPADASSLAYRLVELVNRVEVGPTLETGTWQLVAYTDASGTEVGDFAGNPVTARFESGQVNGNGGCNNYFGSYVTEGSALTIDQVGSTQMACPDPVMQQEQDFLTNLTGVARYAIVGGQLRLADDSGRVTLTFDPRTESGLTGTLWSATGINNGRGGVVSLVIGSEVTAQFGEDGRLTGSAGCNNYTAGYEATDETISIGPAASTRMMCPQPDGLMEQESSYLQALERATVYRIDGDKLELRDDGGALQVSFVAQPGDGATGTGDEGGGDAAAADDASVSVEAPAADAGASGTSDAGEDGTDAGADDLTAALDNLEYVGIEGMDGPIQMVDGEYEGEPYVEGGAARPIASVTDLVTTGEMDGVPSAAVVVYSSTGGSGGFNNLALVQEVDGAPTNVGTVFLGDRAAINGMEIIENQVLIDMITQGPNDPMCCPTQQVLNTYGMVEGEFAQTSSTILGFVTGDNGATAGHEALIGNFWEWVELIGPDGRQRVPNPSDYTLILNDDATAAVQADCNSGSGTYNLNGNSLTIQILAVTMALCPEDSLSDQYLALINQVETYRFVGNVLVLTLSNGQGDLVFAALGSTIDVDDTRGTEQIRSALANLEYTGLSGVEGAVQLTDGSYEGEPFVEGGASRPTAQLTDHVAIGALDGTPSATVIVTSNAGGSGTFYDLAVIQEVDGVPTNVATTLLGDRVQVNELDIADNHILVEMITQGPGDAQCCPTQRVINAYQMQDGALTLTTNAVIGYVEAEATPEAELERSDAQAASAAVLTTDVPPQDALAPGTVPGDAVSLEPGAAAGSYHWRVMPPVPYAMETVDGAPAHLLITFDNETPDEALRGIAVYPIEAYKGLWEANNDNTVTVMVDRLTALLEEQPENPQPPMPLLPPFSTGSDLAAHVAYLESDHGAGVRFIGRPITGNPAVTPAHLYYIYQGLTADEQFYVSAIWAVTADGFEGAPSAAEATDALNALPPETWSPLLEDLDTVIESLMIQLPGAE